MSKQSTQEQFIEKSKQLYGDKYDYSKVVYTKSSDKVCIICSIHGDFYKTPNKHLQGQGCPVCGRNSTKLTSDEFIKRARSVHGDTYDYSKVRYINSKEKVEIICSIHGSFWQTVNEHIVQKHDCPKCGYAKAGLKRCGDNNVAHREDVKQKKMATCKAHFGTKTWAESDEGRKRLHEIIVDEGKLDVMKATCKERYGTDFWTQSDEGKNRLHDIMTSDEIQEKIRLGYDKAYGMHYMQTKEGRNKAKSYIDEDRRKKFRESLINKYGVPYVVFTDEEQRELVRKRIETMRKNKTFNTSLCEQHVYQILCDIFGVNDVCKQYSSNDYPFSCDFYIISRNLYIELNVSWTHGNHWYGMYDFDDCILCEWQLKSKSSDFYKNAINTWTKRDVHKRDIATKHNLNYLTFWKQDLSDFDEWVSAGCPNGNDWERIYSWKE